MAVEAMADGAVKMGLPRDLALRLAAQSLMVSRTLFETKSARCFIWVLVAVHMKIRNV